VTGTGHDHTGTGHDHTGRHGAAGTRHDHTGTHGAAGTDWRPVPILPYLDAAATGAFWTALGFRVSDGSPDGTPYLLAVRDGAELHFRDLPDVDPARSGFSCYLAIGGAAQTLDALHAEWAALPVWRDPLPRLEAPEVKPWGLREMTVLDPAGTVVRLAESA
jgi:hypothetical protein